MTAKKTAKKPEAKDAKATKSQAFSKALDELEALPNLNYKEAKDKLIAVFKAL